MWERLPSFGPAYVVFLPSLNPGIAFGNDNNYHYQTLHTIIYWVRKS